MDLHNRPNRPEYLIIIQALLRLLNFGILSYSLLLLFHHRVAVLDKVTDFLLFLGKLLIVGIVGRNTFVFTPESFKGAMDFLFKTSNVFAGIFSFFFFSGRLKAVEDAAPSLNYYWVPILVRDTIN